MKKIAVLLTGFLIVILFPACSNVSGQKADDIMLNSTLQQTQSSSSEPESTIDEAPSPQMQAPSQENPKLSSSQVTEQPDRTLIAASQEEIVKNIQVTVGNKNFTAELSANVGAAAFAELLKDGPVVISMSDYSGFEKVGYLGTSLPSDNSSITAEEGDIVLYNASQICVFYGSNSWSYTRLAKINDLTGWSEALGSGEVTITFSLLS